MGQQQLLLIVLGIIIVGIALAGGLTLFRENAVDQKREGLINECVNLASMAQSFYMKPSTYGGGGRSFANWVIPAELANTANGTFTITENGSPASSITITAVGNEAVTSGDPVEVTIRILPKEYQITIVH